MKNCIYCNSKLIKKSQYKYCSNACQAEHTIVKKINSGSFSDKTVKKFLLKTFGAFCSECNLSEWLGGPITLELDHKDGNSTNNQLDNLRLMCPNCHSLTPTYKNRNKGNGRAIRRQRYQEGKSY